MKLPSLNHVITNAGKTIFRFPFETLCAVVATTCAHMLIEDVGNKEVLRKIAMCSSLGLVLFLSSSLFFDTSKQWASKRFFVKPFLLLLVIGYYFTFSYEPKEIELLHFFVLNVCFHLSVSFAAFINKGFTVDEFWEFNKRLFLRILTAGLYSGVLFAGLSLAITALKELFNLEIRGEAYGHLFFTIAGIFNTLFFLAGVPKLNAEKLETEYPKGLKAFTQFVLLPLVSIYLIILIAYEGKILITMSLPYGWVSILILIYAIFGILSFLLIFPISHLEDNKWMKTFNKWFYYFLVPLLGLLYWAITYRLTKYGFTPERYYVLVLALWLTFIVAYFLTTKSQHLKLIPLSLCLTGLLTIYGPQSAQSVSKSSQLNRFVNYMHQNDIKRLSEEDQIEMSSVVDYIITYHGHELLIENAEHKLDSIASQGIGTLQHKTMTALGLEYHSNGYGSHAKEYFNISSSSTKLHEISGYDFIAELSTYGNIDCDSCLNLNGKNYAIRTAKNAGILTLNINDDKIVIDAEAFANNLKPATTTVYKQAELTQVVENENFRVKVVYADLSGKIKDEKYSVQSFSGIICIDVKP